MSIGVDSPRIPHAMVHANAWWLTPGIPTLTARRFSKYDNRGLHAEPFLYSIPSPIMPLPFSSAPALVIDEVSDDD